MFTISQPVAVTFSGLTIRNGYNQYGPELRRLMSDMPDEGGTAITTKG